MSNRRNRRQAALAIQATELAVAAPLVAAHRLSRLALAGHRPDRRDRREFALMGAEKVAAFHESWNAMFMQTLRIQQEIVASMWRPFHSPRFTPWPWVVPPTLDLPHSTLRVLAKGMAPVHRRVVANARRLGRTSVR
ncbi:MAG TPA: polyhydroxyalkanoate granule-associated phasin [Casimicrobiaceae bacterium]